MQTKQMGEARYTESYIGTSSASVPKEENDVVSNGQAAVNPSGTLMFILCDDFQVLSCSLG